MDGCLKAAVFAALFSLIVPAVAVDKATREECIAKCTAAADLMESEGVAEAFKKINDKGGGFCLERLVCVLPGPGKAVQRRPPHQSGSHRAQPLMMAKDVKGKMFFAEFISVALNQGEGWVNYMWPKPGAQGAFPENHLCEESPQPSLRHVRRHL